MRSADSTDFAPWAGEGGLASTTRVMPAVRPAFPLALCVLAACGMVPRSAAAQTIRVDVGAGAAAESFVPNQALGAGIDRLSSVTVERFFTRPAVDRVLSAGWQTVSYRQNTELHAEAWHWNPQGTWSDPAGRGYFTGGAATDERIEHSYGYLLPHRGVTRNDGTDTNGYSRLTDGDVATYWKSNPYLTKPFTGENDALHPQWVTLDLASPLPIDALRIALGGAFRASLSRAVPGRASKTRTSSRRREPG